MIDPALPRQLAWPPRLEFLPDGTAIVAEVEQDTTQEIVGGVAMFCAATTGTVAWDPEFGIPGALGGTDSATEAKRIETAIAAREDRLDFAVTVAPGPDGGRELRLRVLA